MQVSHCDLTSFHKLPSQTVIFTCEGINLTVTLAPFVFVFVFFKRSKFGRLGEGRRILSDGLQKIWFTPNL